MSRAGANPNWEWQLVSREGHTKDSGLRQRLMVMQGHREPNKRHKLKRLAKAVKIDLEALFK